MGHRGRVILHLSPTCVSLSPSNKYAMDALGCMVPHFSPPLLPFFSTCLAVCCGCFGPHDSACLRLFSDLPPTCLPFLGSAGSHGARIVSLTYLPVCCRCSGPHEPTLLSHIRSRWSGPPESKRVSLVSHLSPTVSKYAVDALGRIILHLYPTCLWMLWAA